MKGRNRHEIEQESHEQQKKNEEKAGEVLNR